MSSYFQYVYIVELHLVVLYTWYKVRVHYRAEKKYKKCLGKLRFKGQLQADSFLVELVFILLSHISQGDS